LLGEREQDGEETRRKYLENRRFSWILRERYDVLDFQEKKW